MKLNVNMKRGVAIVYCTRYCIYYEGFVEPVTRRRAETSLCKGGDDVVKTITTEWRMGVYMSRQNMWRLPWR